MKVKSAIKSFSVLFLLAASLYWSAALAVVSPDLADIRGSATDLPESEELLNQIKYEYGSIINPEEYPSLHAMLAKVFSELSSAQGRLTEGSAATVNYVHIIDSSVLNAFVWTDNKTGVRVLSNHLFLTTEMLRFMTSGSSIEEGLLRLAGVIAHEMGHPMDKTSATNGRGEISINDHYGKEASQAIEIRADIDAVRILREANYPVDALYKSLAYLFSKEKTGSLVESAASSHPQHEFRLTSARLFLTLDRLEKGLLENPKNLSADREEYQTFVAELEKVIPKLGRYPYKVPTSLEEIVTRIKALRGGSTVARDFLSLEYNRLVLSFDRILWDKQQQNQELTREERDAFETFINQVFDAGSDPYPLHLYTPTEIRSKINSQSGFSGLENSPSHFYYVERLNIYKSPEVARFLKSQSHFLLPDTDFSGQLTKHFMDRVFAAASVSDPDLFFAQFGKPMSEMLKRLWINDSKKSNTYMDLDFFSKIYELGFRFQAKLAQLMEPMRKGIEQVPFVWKALEDSMIDHWSPIPLISDRKEKSINPLLLKYRQALVYLRSGKHPEVQSQVDAIRRICQDVWDARGFYGTTEILFRGNMIDWNFIFEVLNLHRDVALNQTEAEVQKYMKGEREYRGVPPYKTLMLGASLKEFNSQKGLDNWLVWNSRNLKKAILGESKPSSQFDSTEKEQAQQFLGIFRLKNKKAFASDYQEAFKETLSHSYKTPADLLLAIAAANNSFFANGSLNNRYEITQWDNVYFKKTHLEMIEKSNYTIAEKKAWFEALFLKRTFFPKTEQQKAWNEFNYVIHESNDPNINYMKNPRFAGRILEVYRKLYGQGPLDFFFKLKDFSKNLLSDDTVFFRALDTSENSLQADLKLRSLSNFDELQKIISLMKPRESRKSIYEKSLKYADSTEVAALSNSQAAQINSARIQRLKKTILEKASQLHLTLEQKFQIFLDLTESGPTRDTDQFFASLVDLTKLDPQMKSQVLGYLEEGRFNSDKIKLDLAKVFIGDRVHRLQTEVIDKGSKVDRYTINKLIKDLNRYTPNGSLAKDNFLESIAWSLRLRGSELDGFIEDQKSQNWRKANPMLIRVGSMLATQLSSMSFEGRLKFIEYLLDPVKNETTLFTDIFEDLKKMTYNDLLKEAVSEGNKILSPQKQNELKERADRYAEILKLKAEEAIRDSSPTERIPLFEVVLTAGKEAPIKKSDWPQNIARRYLGYEPGSVEEALLTSFLEILPQHEPAVALAYMLSLSKDESSGSIAQLFEVFGTVGIKFGQLVSIWELFGKKIAKDTAHLKNNAKALTRYDVINIADSRHHEIKEIIEEFEKVLGSASIKTTVRVRFKDGSKGVLALQGKNVQEIVSMNVQLGKRFLERLKQKEVIKNSKFMMNLVEAMEEQIGAELDMKGEALKTKQAGQILEELNKELKADLKGWTIRAPQVLKDKPLTNQLAFYELAGSVSYDQLSPELKAQVGPMIAKANLKSLFKYGWFDPDRHTGNFLIEEKSKTIFFLDFGQFQDFSKSANPFKVDPRLVMGKFIQSLSALDSASVIHYASLMARPGDTSVVDKVQMRKSLDAIFAEAKTQAKPDIKDLMVRAINEIAESGLKFDTRYIFGGLKGLIVLYGENYVSTKDFEGLLRNELQSLFAKKVPALITESFRSPEKSSPGPALRCEGLFLKN